jgi:hypothetical protein
VIVYFVCLVERTLQVRGWTELSENILHGKKHIPDGHDMIKHDDTSNEDSNPNEKHKEKKRTCWIKEHITVEHDKIKHMTHRMRERDTTAQNEIKSRAHSRKGHATGGHDNIKHMTNRMVESIPNRQEKINIGHTG